MLGDRAVVLLLATWTTHKMNSLTNTPSQLESESADLFENVGHDGVDERHLGVDGEAVKQVHGQRLDGVGGHTVGPRHGGEGGGGAGDEALSRRAAHRLHQGRHRHLEELLGGGEGVAEEGDVVGDGGDVEAAGGLRDVGQELLVPLQGGRQAEGEPQVVTSGLLLQVDEDGGGGQGLHTAGAGRVRDLQGLRLVVHTGGMMGNVIISI